MSAEVEEITLYSAGCSACCVGIDATGDLEFASEWAANHDAENHNEDDRTDADYDHYKESLRDQ